MRSFALKSGSGVLLFGHTDPSIVSNFNEKIVTSFVKFGIAGSIAVVVRVMSSALPAYYLHPIFALVEHRL